MSSIVIKPEQLKYHDDNMQSYSATYDFKLDAQ